MTHRIATREEWDEAREKLLVREKEHTRLGDELAVFPDAVARQIGADIKIVTECRHARIARGGGADQRTWFGIEVAEVQEIGRQRLRQNGKVTLHVARREASRRTAMRSGPDCKARRKPAGGLRWVFSALRGKAHKPLRCGEPNISCRVVRASCLIHGQPHTTM